MEQEKLYTAIAGYGDYIKEPFDEEDLKQYCKDNYTLEVNDIVYELVPRYKVVYKNTGFGYDLIDFNETKK